MALFNCLIKGNEIFKLLPDHAKEAKAIMEEVHEGICGTHANGHMLARQIQRAGDFWLTLETDCIEYVRKCHKCQIYADKINAPPVPLHNMVAPWPFSMWDMDVIGPIIPCKWSSIHSGGHWLLHEVGRSSLLCQCDEECGSSLPKKGNAAMGYLNKSSQTMLWIWITRWWMSSVPNFKFCIIIQLPIAQRWMGQLKLRTRIKIGLCRRWRWHIRIGMKCSRSRSMHIAPLWELLLGQALFLWYMGWKPFFP